MKKNIYILLIGLLVLTGFSSSTTANGVRDTKSMFKAIFISEFATLIDWPSDYRKGFFTIEVYDNDNALFNMLTKKYAGKAVGSQEILVKKYNPKQKIKSHIIYVSDSYTTYIPKIVTSIKNKSTLLISDSPNGLKRGSTINFVINNNRQQFEISKSNAKKHKLIIASKLTSLAVRVK